MRTGVCTIIAKNHLPFARVLMSSVRQHDPDMLRIAVLVDGIEGRFDPAGEDFEIIPSDELGIANPEWFRFKYSILELSTALKPYALEFVLNRYGLDRILYLDPDIRVYRSLRALCGRIDPEHPILLTPHLTDSLDDLAHPTELDILMAGAYNLGFIGISNSPEARRFLTWWQSRLYDQCLLDTPRGLFFDQRWMDLAPGLFSGVVIERSPGYNVAYWNLIHRRPVPRHGTWTVNGEPLHFFHFSGFDPNDFEKFSRHQTRFRTSELNGAATIAREYVEELMSSGYQQCRRWPYDYARFRNGVYIPDIGRRIQQEYPDIIEKIRDPFSVEGFRLLLSLWSEPIRTFPDGCFVSRLAYRIYRTRPELQAAFPDLFGADLMRFFEWVISCGKIEYGLDDVFVAPVREAMNCRCAGGGGGISEALNTVAEDRVRACYIPGGNTEPDFSGLAVEAGGAGLMPEPHPARKATHHLRFTGQATYAQFRRRTRPMRWASSYHFDNQYEVRGDYDIGADIADYGFPECMAGMHVLTVSVSDGWFSHYFEQKGAEVVALDAMPRSDGRETPSRTMSELLGSRVLLRSTSVSEISSELFTAKFDLVFLDRVLTRLRDPVATLSAVRAFCANQVMIATPLASEAAKIPSTPFPDARYATITNGSWRVPSEACLRSWLLVAGFCDVDVTREALLRADLSRTMADGTPANPDQILRIATAYIA